MSEGPSNSETPEQKLRDALQSHYPNLSTTRLERAVRVGLPFVEMFVNLNEEPDWDKIASSSVKATPPRNAGAGTPAKRQKTEDFSWMSELKPDHQVVLGAVLVTNLTFQIPVGTTRGYLMKALFVPAAMYFLCNAEGENPTKVAVDFVVEALSMMKENPKNSDLRWMVEQGPRACQWKAKEFTLEKFYQLLSSMKTTTSFKNEEGGETSAMAWVFGQFSSRIQDFLSLIAAALFMKKHLSIADKKKLVESLLEKLQNGVNGDKELPPGDLDSHAVVQRALDHFSPYEVPLHEEIRRETGDKNIFAIAADLMARPALPRPAQARPAHQDGGRNFSDALHLAKNPTSEEAREALLQIINNLGSDALGDWASSVVPKYEAEDEAEAQAEDEDEAQAEDEDEAQAEDEAEAEDEAQAEAQAEDETEEELDLDDQAAVTLPPRRSPRVQRYVG